jgi:hypothetical protein
MGKKMYSSPLALLRGSGYAKAQRGKKGGKFNDFEK